MTRHVPVLLKETIEALAVKPGGRYVDGTLGRAGHAREIIARGGRVLGIDRDPQAIAEVEEMGIAGLKTVKGRHGDIARLARENGMEKADGVILDLGVSSPQLDEAERGFSFCREGSLDMRMDASQGASAADIVNGESADRLEEVFRTFGEEPRARQIARAIVAERAKGRRFGTTVELAEFVEKTVGRRGARHPATRVFQALRMAVNDEMEDLKRALEGGLEILDEGGRFAVITFESLTDRAVKRFFAAHAGRFVSLQQGGERWEGSLPRVAPVTKKAVVATEEEVDANPRSRSARLRAVQKGGCG
ncbi:MAG: 16S rRNA (cytosine(1402)-N(4))-methyltransferase RsmH [Kiritimatiellae bacterium]|nr:16S rRNA (cytosine(1402)-N(4))-methyltransferase RsmH [Kiritimatiellia bacterium]